MAKKKKRAVEPLVWRGVRLRLAWTISSGVQCLSGRYAGQPVRVFTTSCSPRYLATIVLRDVPAVSTWGTTPKRALEAALAEAGRRATAYGRLVAGLGAR